MNILVIEETGTNMNDLYPKADNDNYEAFYELYHPKVVNFLTGKCATRQDAEDLAHEAFLYCYRHWSDYDPEKASRKTWLFLIVRSRWKNYRRDHKTISSLDQFEEIIPAADVLEQAVWLQAVRTELANLLEALPEKQREAIVLRYFAQWTDEEIAKWHTTSQGNVRVMIHRGIQHMNKEFTSHLRTVLTK